MENELPHVDSRTSRKGRGYCRSAALADADDSGNINPDLLSAVDRNDVQAMEELLKEGADLNGLDSGGNTVLHSAAALGHAGVCSLLLDFGADGNCQNNADITPLFLAARVSLPTVRVLLQRGRAHAGLPNHLGEIPLHAASSSGLVDVIVELVTSGSDVNARSFRGVTPLYLCVGSGSKMAVKTLIRLGADVNQVLGGEERHSGRDDNSSSCGGVPWRERAGTDGQAGVCGPRQGVLRLLQPVYRCRETRPRQPAPLPPPLHLSQRQRGPPFPSLPHQDDPLRPPRWREEPETVRPDQHLKKPLLPHPSLPDEDAMEESCPEPQSPQPSSQSERSVLDSEHPQLSSQSGQRHLEAGSASGHRKRCSSTSTIPTTPQKVLERSTEVSLQQQHQLNQPLPSPARQHARQKQAGPASTSSYQAEGILHLDEETAGEKETRCEERLVEGAEDGGNVNLEGQEDMAGGRPAGQVGKHAGQVGRPAGQVGRPAGQVGRHAGLLASRGPGVARDTCRLDCREGRRGITPLHRACQLGMESTARVLLDCGADVNGLTSQGESPLHMAARYASTFGAGEVSGVLRLLLAAGADVEAATEPAGETALHLAALVGDALAASVLTRVGGADAGRRDRRGNRPLHGACERLVSPEANRVRTVRVLLAAGARADCCNEDGLNPLQLLLLQRDDGVDLDVARVLLQHGADPNRPTPPGGDPPLLLALRHGMHDFAAVLVEGGADPTVSSPSPSPFPPSSATAGHRDAGGTTPLHYACKAGNSRLFQLLWSKGGDLVAVDARGFTPLRYAVEIREGALSAVVGACVVGGASTRQPFTGCPGIWGSVTDVFRPSPNTPCPFVYAFSTANLALLTLLTSSGCWSFSTLHSLATLCDTADLHLLTPAQTEVIRFVQRLSQSPPSLQNLCRWEISRLIGCRADRKWRARHLGLPSMLRDFVLCGKGE